MEEQSLLARWNARDRSSDGCDSTVTLILTVNAIGIDDVEDVEVSVNLYPNPTRGMVNIATEEEVLKVEVYDINGRKVASVNNTDRVDLSGMATGTYTMRVQTGRGTTVRRVILK